MKSLKNFIHGICLIDFVVYLPKDEECHNYSVGFKSKPQI